MIKTLDFKYVYFRFFVTTGVVRGATVALSLSRRPMYVVQRKFVCNVFNISVCVKLSKIRASLMLRENFLMSLPIGPNVSHSGIMRTEGINLGSMCIGGVSRLFHF